MDKSSLRKILHRIEEDASLIAIMASKNMGREVLDGEDFRELRRSCLVSLADLETLDSFLGTFERRGKTDRYISTDRIQTTTANVVTPQPTIC